jgi:hypothetical protein
MPVIPATWEVKVGESQCEAGLGKSVRPYLKKKKKLKQNGLELWLKCMPSKCEALSSNFSTAKKKEKRLNQNISDE